MPTNLLQPQRHFDPLVQEWMDEAQPVSDRLERDLSSLEHLNRYFGSYSLVEYFLDRWIAPGAPATLLDLCTASADIPRRMVRWARHRQIQLRITAIELQESTLEIARARCTGYPEIQLTRADALRFKPAEPHDFVLCSLALHHFGDAEAVALLRRMRAFASRGVLVADLERTDFGMLGIHALTATLFREPMTRHDARLSFRRAFSFREMAAVAQAAGWKSFGHRRFPVCRQAIWLKLAEAQKR